MASLLLGVIYVAFISLGLPDSLLGSAWPTMSQDLNVPVAWAGGISAVISMFTIVSALLSDRMTLKFGAGKVTAVSVALTAAALAGFSVAPNYWVLLAIAIPYGLGAGGVDAALNNYVAIHYESRHMSWLHCMWGVGTTVGPYVMSYALTGGLGWNMGYRIIGFMQMSLTIILLFSLPLWKGRGAAPADDPVEVTAKATLSLRQIFRIPGAKEVMLAFFGYCALEMTAMLWASSYMVLHNRITPEAAAGYASLFFIGITVGRAVNGFLTFKFTDVQMIRAGQGIIAVGAAAMLLPLGSPVTLAGLVLIGLGCAPIYPCIIHSTPAHFGADRSQALIGVQMASAYVGTCLMPPLFGLLANHISVSLLPVYLLALLVLMAVMHEKLIRKTRKIPADT